MAYPFAPAPRFLELKQKLIEQGCEYKTRSINVEDEGEQLGPISYFERTVGGETRTAVVEISDDEFVVWSVVRSICARLDTDPKIFGLDLG